MVIYEIIKNGLFTGSLVGLMAVAFSLIYKVTRVFHIAIGAVFLVGGYTTYLISHYFAFPLYVLVILSVIASIAFGFIVELFLYRKMDSIGSSGSMRLIGSLSILIIISSIVTLIIGSQINNISNSDDTSYSISILTFTSGDIRHLAISGILILLLSYTFKSRLLGLKIMALADNANLVQILGINAFKYRNYATLISSALVGVVAALITYRQGIDPSSAWPIALSSAVAMIIGVNTIIEGPFFAGLIIGCLRSFVVYYLSDEWSDFAIYMLFLFVLLFKKKTLLDVA